MIPVSRSKVPGARSSTCSPAMTRAVRLGHFGEASTAAVLGQGDSYLRNCGWKTAQVKADAVADRSGLVDGRRESGCAGGMLWCIEEDHSAVIDHFACVSDEEGRQVHVEICAGGMRYQDLAIGLVDRCVLAGFQGLTQFGSPIPWLMCRRSRLDCIT